VARHRVPGEEPAERAGTSPVVLIVTVVALVVFAFGVVWAAIGKPHVVDAPPVAGGSTLAAPGRTINPASPASAGPAASTTPVPRGPNVRIGDPSGRPAAGATATMPAPRSPITGGLTVTVSTSSWNEWYSADYTVTNHTPDMVNGWTVTVTFETRVAAVHAWRANESIAGAEVTLTSMPYNSALKPGESAFFSLRAAGGNEVTPVPVSCTVNGLPCSG
jgi:cellulase/cellobiase CelA1